ncbi:transcriptional regulator [Noviherbaspirillum saxi]|uniref:Transcriptional regulator n=1 Tax=Noviherbaspirillum saxi TaxID=2320863 RepID=A0A3A3FHN5_9BURK|nr:transcriptional regulator [Noviherbaspirillum saxi]RJF91908.1 transcriptional regulator [Noviherbaspirillum saxi]
MQDLEIDPSIPEVMRVLWEARHDARSTPWSLAKLTKRAGLPMSILRRALTQLQSIGLVEVHLVEEGRGHVSLTEAGAQLATKIFSL